ncbi:MAG: hypothetical protein ACOYZ8_00840 [Chloroflexota bacterium]
MEKKQIKKAPRRPAQTSRPAKPSQGMDLASLFNMATQALAANRGALNQADAYNQNHGDNMVQIFDMITQALSSKAGAPPSQQLAHASQYLAVHGTSGSAKAYSQGLAQAARQFEGQSVTPNNAMMLVQSLLGGGAPAGQGSQGGGALDAIMDLTRGEKLDSNDVGALLNAGMAFLGAKQQGQDNMQAAISALVSGGPMGQSPHRAQSGELVANVLMQAISAMGRK